MSSGSGKKKVVAAAAPPLSGSIAPERVESQTSTGGLIYVIEKGRIVNTLSSKSQSSLLRQPVTDVQSASQVASNEDYLTNGGSQAGASTSVTSTVPVAKSLASSSFIGIHGKGGVEKGEMRVKVTGEDRNGQSIVTTGGQLVQGMHYNSVLGRRPSTNRRQTVPTTSETDGINGQPGVPPYAKITLSVGNTLKNRVTTSIQPAKILPTAAKIPAAVSKAAVSITNLAPQESNAPSQPAMSYRVGVTDLYCVPSVEFNQGHGKVSYKDESKNLVDGSNISSVTIKPNIASNSTSTIISSDHIPTNSVNVQNDNVVVMTSGETTARNSNLKGGNSTATGARENNAPRQLYITKPVLKDSTDIDTTSLSKAPDEEVTNKPSREIKSLQSMQSASKILTGFIEDTSSKGKLRKRHSDGSAEVESVNMDSSIPGTTTQSASRKRLRRQSTFYTNTMEDNSKGLATESDYKLDDVPITAPVVRGRKVRSSAKTDLSPQKATNDQNEGSLKEGCKDKDFFSSLNLGSNEHNKTSEQLFPANPPKPGWDRFCWRCKKSGPNLACSKCIRSYHGLCVRYSVDDPNWSCTECKMALHVRADIESMSKCLGFVLDIIAMQAEVNELFNPIDKSALPHYDKYITRHMDLAVLKKNLAQRAYKAPEEFLADMSWIVHNMSIYPDKIMLLKHARAMQKKAKNEIDEMEPCHECYIYANTRSEHWFKEPCSKPHLLVWAKLRGFPYWPGKLYVISASNQAYVRFFATHDRSWLPVKDCFLYSKQDPNPVKNMKNKLMASLVQSVTDIEHHITRLREQFNTFNYGPYMELVDPARFEEQQRAMLPGAYLKKVKVTIKRSEGEMVAVASASNDEVQNLPTTAKARLEVVKNATLANKEPAKKGAIISPSRKRMTRRMSRFLRNAEEGSEQPLVNAGGPENTNLPIASAVTDNDKAIDNDKRSQSDRTLDDKKMEQDNSKDPDCNPKNLSLLFRRGSQSWESEPLVKRRKSAKEKPLPTSAVVETHSIASCTDAQETAVTNIANKDVAEPTLEKGTNALDAVIDTTCNQHAAKEASDTLESTTNSAPVVSDPPVCVTSTEINPSSKAETDIKQEIIAGDEVNTVTKAKNLLPSPKEHAPKDNSTTLDAAKGQAIPAVRSGNVVKVVQQTTPAVLAISAVGGKTVDSNTAAVTIVPSNQRARKSFPGGMGGNNAKNATYKQAPSLGANVLHTDMLTSHSSKNVCVSIPKDLITPVGMVSNDVVAASVCNDNNDDVVIIEDDHCNNDTVATQPASPQSETSQFLPTLVSKPSPPSSTDSSTNELNNTMQLLDASSNRVLDYIRMVMEDMLKDLVSKGSSLAEVAMLKLNQERQNELWLQQKEAMQRDFEGKMAELRISLGQDKERALKKQRQQLFADRERAVQDAKMKQWCTKCYREASYYCCWNTSYCSMNCQNKHWNEHQPTHNTSTKEQANVVQAVRLPIQPSLSETNLLVSQTPDNSAALPSRSCISIVPSKKSPNNRVIATSTPLQTPVRYMPGTKAGNVGYKTPIIQSVHGRDSMVLKLTQQAAQNGSNATSIPNTPQQQQQLKKTASRDKSMPNQQKTVSPNKANVSKKPYVIASLPYQSTASMLISPTTTIVPMVTSPAYVTVTPSEELAGSSRVSSGVWNQMTMMQPTTNRQLHPGTVFSTAGVRDGTENGGHRQNLPTITIVAQQTKPVQQPSTTTYMRHQL